MRSAKFACGSGATNRSVNVGHFLSPFRRMSDAIVDDLINIRGANWVFGTRRGVPQRVPDDVFAQTSVLKNTASGRADLA
jgi:hypothetical protein